MKPSRGAARRLSVILAAAVLVLAGAALPANADPDPDGGNQSLQQKLDVAVRAYNDAKGRLDVAHARQAALQQQLAATQQRLTDLEAAVGPIASAAYRGTRMSVSNLFLVGDAPGAMLHDAATVQYLAAHEDEQLREVARAKKDYATQKSALDGQIAVQEQQLTVMAQRRSDAEKALGNPAAGGGVSTASLPGNASPAPRNKDGSYPAESCSIKDPTTSGCITARMLHAYNAARAAGFTHYTACFRREATGEHGKGRACDFSANATTFVNARATGADKAYGDRLAAWFVANANQLAVLYVIWYDQIWLPGSGWKKYTAGDGSPAGDHYNHVHLSVN